MVMVTDAAGNSSSESSTNELTIDLTPPLTPTINSLLTNTGTPAISGNAIVVPGGSLSVEVNSIIYTAGNGNLVVNGDGSWVLGIPEGNSLDEDTYDVQATVTDAAGNSATDSTINELTIDLTPPPAPGVTSQTTNDSTPMISGTTTVGTGMVLRVEVDGVIYIVGDGHLVDNGCLLYTSDAADE